MKKWGQIILQILFYFVLLLGQLFCSSQSPKKQRCAAYESTEEFRRLYPNAETDKQFEDWLNVKIQERKKSKPLSTGLITIPIIFHIVHDGEPKGEGRNLDADKIAAQIFQLNEDFANRSESTYGAVSANIEIQFCPAAITSDGIILSEPGIDRIDRHVKGWDAPPYSITIIGSNTIINPLNHVDKTIIPESIWNPEKYFNVWILDLETEGPYGNSIFPISSGLPGLFTVTPDNDTHSGVYINYRCVGSKTKPGVYTTFAGLGRTLTHETGHFLGLRHIWGDGNCNTDYCDDTPTQADATENCPNSTLPQYKQNCPNNGDGDKRMFENYMDYTDDVCTNTFTQDQKIRMRTVIENSPRRVSLATSNVCCVSPDLLIVNPEINISSITAGNPVTVTYNEKNSGWADAPPNYISFHLSSDNVLTPGENGDIYLDEYFFDLPAYAFTTSPILSKEITIPSTVPPGTYYLFFSADGGLNVSECDESNNFATAIITVSDAQSATQAAYRYWFDDKFTNAVLFNTSISSNNYKIEGNVPTTIIQNGLHSFNIQFKDINDKWSTISSSLFYKGNSVFPKGSPRYEYWFDDIYSKKITPTINSTNNLILLDNLNSENLSSGLHALNIRFKPDGRHWSTITTSFFYKLEEIPSGIAQYEYWFDNAYDDKISPNNTNTNNFVLLDNIYLTNISNGLHTLNIRFRPNGKNWSSVTSSFFYKNNDALVPINNLSKFLYWYDNNWQNPKTISIIGVDNINWTLNTDAAELTPGRHNLSMMFKDDRGKWSSIVSDSFTSSSVIIQFCLTGNQQFSSGVVSGNNSTYQWQVDNGTGFTNISNNEIYSGVTNDILHLTNAPSSWYGYKYRCLVTYGNNIISGVSFILKFVASWNGSIDNNWENPDNWSCSYLPDVNTDVYINDGMIRYPQVNTDVFCRRLNLQPGTSIEIKSGIKLIVTGNGN